MNNPMLDRIRIVSPCSANFGAMTGDAQRRFCGQCQQHVHDLSAMSRSAAEQLLREADGKTCVRFCRRPDGTVQTFDAEPGWVLRPRRRLGWLWARAMGFAAGVLGLAAECQSHGALESAGEEAMRTDSWVAVARTQRLMGRVLSGQYWPEGSEWVVPEAPAPTQDDEVKTVRLEHVSATEMASVLAELVHASVPVSVWLNAATNSIMLRGSTKQIREIMELIVRLDVR